MHPSRAKCKSAHSRNQNRCAESELWDRQKWRSGRAMEISSATHLIFRLFDGTNRMKRKSKQNCVHFTRFRPRLGSQGGWKAATLPGGRPWFYEGLLRGCQISQEPHALHGVWCNGRRFVARIDHSSGQGCSNIYWNLWPALYCCSSQRDSRLWNWSLKRFKFWQLVVSFWK